MQLQKWWTCPRSPSAWHVAQFDAVVETCEAGRPWGTDHQRYRPTVAVWSEWQTVIKSSPPEHQYKLRAHCHNLQGHCHVTYSTRHTYWQHAIADPRCACSRATLGWRWSSQYDSHKDCSGWISLIGLHAKRRMVTEGSNDQLYQKSWSAQKNNVLKIMSYKYI